MTTGFGLFEGKQSIDRRADIVKSNIEQRLMFGFHTGKIDQRQLNELRTAAREMRDRVDASPFYALRDGKDRGQALDRLDALVAGMTGTPRF